MAAVVFHIVFTFAAPGRNLALFFVASRIRQKDIMQ